MKNNKKLIFAYDIGDRVLCGPHKSIEAFVTAYKVQGKNTPLIYYECTWIEGENCYQAYFKDFELVKAPERNGKLGFGKEKK